jgi:hypothetical protein
MQARGNPSLFENKEVPLDKAVKPKRRRILKAAPASESVRGWAKSAAKTRTKS